MKKLLRGVGSLLPLLLVILVSLAVWLKHDAIIDWSRLRTYQPPSTIAQLASQDTMTPLGKHLFYVNQPKISDRTSFNSECTNHTEQTVVLGCYHGNRQGIFIFDVTQPELNGVQQVTAAHEMLHQAYDRLGKAERNRIDQLLQDYYDHDLTDQGIKDQMAGYRKSEPSALVDEMHSVFGTEVLHLPAELEQYYQRYFIDRTVVAGFYQSYQAAFTQRNQQILEYDSQLAAQKQQIDTLQASLDSQAQVISTQKALLDQKQANHDVAAYNALVPAYNQLVNTYNKQLQTLRDEIDGYNQLVAARNAIAVQEQELQQDLSSQKLPTAIGE